MTRQLPKNTIPCFIRNFTWEDAEKNKKKSGVNCNFNYTPKKVNVQIYIASKNALCLCAVLYYWFHATVVFESVQLNSCTSSSQEVTSSLTCYIITVIYALNIDKGAAHVCQSGKCDLNN